MKKNLFYLFALICSVSLFTACSDDDDSPAGWEQLPSTPISAENLTLSTNSQTVEDAAVTLAMQDAQSGVLTMTNAVRGYDNIEVPVTVTEQADGSFKFAGEKSLTVSTRALSDLINSTLVKVNGIVSIDGKAEVTVTTEANGNLVRKWQLCNALQLNEETKLWDFAPFKLNWISPYGLNGNTGIAADNLQLMGTQVVSMLMTKMLKDVEFTADGNIVANYAKDVKFEASEIIGGILGGGGLPSTEGIEWVTSPKNLAYWVPADNHVKVVLNIPAIVAQANADSEKPEEGITPEAIQGILNMLKGMDGAAVKELLSTVLPSLAEQIPLLAKLDVSVLNNEEIEKLIDYVFNGIPVNFKMQNTTLSNGNTVEHLSLYIDKKFLDPLMPLLYPLLPDLDAIVKDIEIEMMGSPMKIWDMVSMLLGIQSLTEVEGLWKETTLFEAGLDFGTSTFVVEKPE